MNREQKLVLKVNKQISKIPKQELKEEAYLHLHGVSHLARMIGRRRGLNEELLAVAGLLHDLFQYVKDQEKDHARQWQSIC